MPRRIFLCQVFALRPDVSPKARVWITIGTQQGQATGQMQIERKFTTEGKDAYAALSFTTTVSEIRNPDGKIVFRNDAVEVPEGWSQVASDVIAQKY
ncbi:MAG: hypothetical protein KDJ98_11770, partial [Rhodobacteraceae bacterium]|nr:hypothetical protein [Paracoccaceae bacterium]